jgi:hypothetical protein
MRKYFDLIIFKFQTYPYISIHFDDRGLFEYPGNFDFDDQDLFNISNMFLKLWSCLNEFNVMHQ